MVTDDVHGDGHCNGDENGSDSDDLMVTSSDNGDDEVIRVGK